MIFIAVTYIDESMDPTTDNSANGPLESEFTGFTYSSIL